MIPTSTIINNFAACATSYDDSAHIQSIASEYLSLHMESIEIPAGSVLEAGSGTGLFSEKLVSYLSGRRITFSDASPQMLSHCRKRIGNSSYRNNELRFEQSDLTGIFQSTEKYSLIATSFLLQWFSDFDSIVKQLASRLNPGGILLFSVPGSDSFEEWKSVCSQNNHYFTGNNLPSVSHIETLLEKFNCEHKVKSHRVVLSFDNSIDFFRTFSKTGSHTRTGGQLSSYSNLKNIVNAWNKSSPAGIEVTYEIVTAHLRMD